MNRDKQVKSLIFFSQSGCLLPLLIIFNLFFGWMMFKTSTWLIMEAVLVLVFLLNSLILMKRISAVSPARTKRAIDIEAEVVEEDRQQA